MTDLITFAIPFFFMLAIVYGALEVSGLFKNKAVNMIIALVVAFFAAMTAQVAEIIFAILPYAIILFIVVFFLGFLRSLFSKKTGSDYTLLLMIAILVLIFFSSQDLLSDLGLDILFTDTVISIIGFIIIIIIFYAAYKGWSNEAPTQ